MYTEKIEKPTVSKESVVKAAKNVLKTRTDVFEIVLQLVCELIETGISYNGGVVEEPVDDFLGENEHKLYELLLPTAKHLVENESFIKKYEHYDPDHPLNKKENEERVNRVIETLKDIQGSVFYDGQSHIKN